MTAKSPAPTSAAPPALAREPEIWAYDGDGYQITEAARPHMRVAFLPSNATGKRRRELGHLIAAAPEMLAALKDGRHKLSVYVTVYSGDKELRRLLTEWDAAIAKAEGRT